MATAENPVAMIEPLMAQLEEVIWRVAQRKLGPVRQRELVLAVQELSRRYNRPEGEAVRLEGNLPMRQARLLFFTLADMPKIALPLAELQAAGRLPLSGSPLRVLDLGAGFGALTLGLLAHRTVWGQEGPVELWAADQDRGGLDILEEVLAEAVRDGILPRSLDLSTKGVNLAARSSLHALEPPFGLILAGGLLNELPEGAEEQLVLAGLKLLAPHGVMVILEPALRHTSRRLHRLRDRLISSGAATVLAPCTRAGHCPMLENQRDWCHERRPWQPPPRLRHLTSATGLRRRDLRYAYLSLSPPGTAQLERPDGAWRVVSDVLGGKGRLEHFVCGEDGRTRAVMLKRHRGGANGDFSRLARGHIVWLDGTESKGDGLRLGPECKVRGIDPVLASGGSGSEGP